MSIPKLPYARSKSKVYTKLLIGPKFKKVSENMSLGQFFFNRAQKYKDNTCQISAVEEKSESYGSIRVRTIRLALEMEKRGISSKDVVAICSDNSMDNMVPVISAMYVGAKVINLDHTMNNRQIRYLLGLVPPSVIFVEEAVMGLIKDTLKEMNLKAEVVLLGQQLKPYKDEHMFTPSKVDVHETAMMFFSSGLSGAPKAACHSHYSLMQLVNTVLNSGLVTNNVLHFTSFCWITVIVILICAFMNGSTRIFCRNAGDGLKICKYIETYRVTSLFMAPAQSCSLINVTMERQYNLSSLRNIILAGSTMPTAHLKALARIFDQANIVFNYGITEVGMVTTFNPDTEVKLIREKVGSCGRVAPETKIKVVRLNNEDSLGPDVKGEIRIKSLGLMKGYHSLDCSEFFDAEGFLKTGDIGYYDEDRCFYVLDRVKETFIYQGHHVVPSFIEAVLLEHPAVKETGVFGVSARDGGEVPAACVVLKEGVYAEEKELEDFVAKRVSDHERLRGGVKFVTAIPKTSMGRCLRRELKNQFLEPTKKSELSLAEGML